MCPFEFRLVLLIQRGGRVGLDASAKSTDGSLVTVVSLALYIHPIHIVVKCLYIIRVSLLTANLSES